MTMPAPISRSLRLRWRLWAICAAPVSLVAITLGCGGRYETYNVGPVATDAGEGESPSFGPAAKDAKSGSAGDAKATGSGDAAGGYRGPGDSAAETAPANSGDDGADATAGSRQAVDAAVGAGCGTQKACKQDADCPAGLCAVGACYDGCCGKKEAPDGTVCDDGSKCTKADQCQGGACSGTPAACDDGLECTLDTCDPKTGKCKSATAAGVCLIAGACAASGEVNSANACKVCDPAKSKSAWSLAPGCCDKDADCPPGGPCEVGSCDLASNQCQLVKTMGCCAKDAECSDGNLCTLDTCDLTTGQCSYQAVSCAAPNACQDGVCDPASGQCNAVTKAGWCFVDGGCHAEGDPNPSNGCQTCSSAKSASSWTVSLGLLCNDGNACTFGDVCNAQGQCKGTQQVGCCKANSDCAPSGDPCAPNICDLATLLCIPQVKAGCCSAGTCCDAAAMAIKPAKSPCGGGPLSVEYQCAGQNIQKREIWAGCNGSSADGCSSAAGAQVAGLWTTTQTCGAGTACTASGSATPPTCKPTGPVGSCVGSCGGKSANGTCWCDSVCSGAGDCCSDFMANCGCSSGECCDIPKKFPKSKGTACGASKTTYVCSGKTLKQQVAQPSCDGKNVCSSAAADLVLGPLTTVKTCTATQNCATGIDNAAGSCTAIPAGSCMGHCGTQSTGTCWCDELCKQIGDCCGDYDAVGCSAVQKCGAKAVGTCSGLCGSQGASSTCWCDSACETFGDCCLDKAVCNCQ